MSWGVQMFPCFAISFRVLRQNHFLHFCGYSMCSFKTLSACAHLVFPTFASSRIIQVLLLTSYWHIFRNLWTYDCSFNLSVLQNNNVSTHAVNLLFVRTAYDSKLLCAIILSCVQCSCLVPQDKSHLLCCGDVFSRSRVSSNPWSGLIRLRQIICNKIFSFPCVLNMDYNPFKSAQSSHPLYLFFYDSKPKFGPHMFNVTPVLWSFHDGLQELIGVALVKVVYLRSMVRKFIYTVQIREFSDQKCQYEISSYWYA